MLSFSPKVACVEVHSDNDSGLNQELPVYATKSSDIPESRLLIAYSGEKAMQLNYLCAHLVQPFSTTAERAFSLLNSSFTDQ